MKYTKFMIPHYQITIDARCYMTAYTVAQNLGKNAKGVKNRKLDADEKWLDCFKVRTPYDMLAYSAIKTKKNIGIR